MRAGEVSQVGQDYLKAIWSAREWGGAPITASELAARFGTTKANTSEVLKRLDELGMVRRIPYRPPELTSGGEELAVAMVRRHRLIETFLVESLGYGWDEVHDEAETLEHAASDRLINRIDAFLGHPAADPHGDPIPGPDGSVTVPDSTLTLAEAGPGAFTVLRVSDADPTVLTLLADFGILPGADIEVVATRELGTAGGIEVARGFGTQRRADAERGAGPAGGTDAAEVLVRSGGLAQIITAQAAAAVHLRG